MCTSHTVFPFPCTPGLVCSTVQQRQAQSSERRPRQILWFITDPGIKTWGLGAGESGYRKTQMLNRQSWTMKTQTCAQRYNNSLLIAVLSLRCWHCIFYTCAPFKNIFSDIKFFFFFNINTLMASFIALTWVASKGCLQSPTSTQFYRAWSCRSIVT